MSKYNRGVVNVMSLGAGVQSSTLCFLYEYGILEDTPDFAIFADTQGEPESVYGYFNYLKSKITKFPIYMATRGDLKDAPQKIPLFIKNKDGSKGMSWRQCTSDYKIKVVDKKVRELLGYKKYERMKHKVNMILGISTDETQRMKSAKDKWKTNVYPLIDNVKFSRSDCIKWYEGKKLKVPPRSACSFCPYRSNREWVEMILNDYDSFIDAMDFDDKVRTAESFNSHNIIGEQFVHPSLKPLFEIDFSKYDEKYNGKINKDIKSVNDINEIKYGMNNECEGMCGL